MILLKSIKVNDFFLSTELRSRSFTTIVRGKLSCSILCSISKFGINVKQLMENQSELILKIKNLIKLITKNYYFHTKVFCLKKLNVQKKNKKIEYKNETLTMLHLNENLI